MARTKNFDENAVLDKAVRLFWAQGFHATSMQDIVDHLGINRASLYDTFGNKQALFDAAMKRYIAHNQQALQSAFDQHPNPRVVLEQLLKQAVQNSLTDQDCKGCFVVNSSTELLPKDLHLQKLLRANQQNFIKVVGQHILAAQQAKIISTKQDPFQLAAYFFTFFNGLNVLAMNHPDEKDLMDTVEITLSILK